MFGADPRLQHPSVLDCLRLSVSKPVFCHIPTAASFQTRAHRRLAISIPQLLQQHYHLYHAYRELKQFLNINFLTDFDK